MLVNAVYLPLPCTTQSPSPRNLSVQIEFPLFLVGGGEWMERVTKKSFFVQQRGMEIDPFFVLYTWVN